MTGLPATSTHPVTAKRPRIGQRCWRALLAVVLVAACDSGGNSGAATDNDATRRAGDAAATTDAASGPDALVPVPSWPPGAPSPFDAQCPGGDPVPFGPDGVTRMVRSCVEGPVFRGDRVRWSDVGTIPADAFGAPVVEES